MSAVLTALQDAVAARLSTHTFFSADPEIEVVSERLQDIESRIQQAVAKIGLCAIVVTPLAETGSPDAPGPELERVTVLVRVVESPTVNRTGQPAAYVAEVVARLLHLWQPTISGQGNAPLRVLALRLADEPARLAYDVVCETRLHLPITAPTRLSEG